MHSPTHISNRNAPGLTAAGVEVEELGGAGPAEAVLHGDGGLVLRGWLQRTDVVRHCARVDRRGRTLPLLRWVVMTSLTLINQQIFC